LDACDADDKTWTLAIESETGWAFQPGPAVVSTFSWAIDGFNYVEQDSEPTVMELTSAPNARIAH